MREQIARKLTLNSNPAENLVRRSRLDGGWRVVKKIPKSVGSTGGNFSVGYVAEDSQGRQAFLKAIDYSTALKAPNQTFVLQALTASFNYEKMLLEKCREDNLDRVALSISDGVIPVGELHPILPVPYLIFELADGDIRRKLDLTSKFDLAFCLRALHHCTTGIRQLHNHKIAHQDLKPSNVLVFDNSDCRVADLGRSAFQGERSPMDQAPIPGDLTYAPPELLYGYVATDWQVRRLACDLYHIGSLAVFFFTKVGITPMWHRFLDRSFWYNNWGQSYKAVLPHVRDAHDLSFIEFEKQVPDQIRVRLGESVRQLCEPDPMLRGHPKDSIGVGSPYSLERYVSRFDLLAGIAEWQMKRTKV